MKTYTITTFSGMWDNDAGPHKRYDLEWEELVEFCSSHTEIEDKQAGPAFVPGLFKTPEQGAEPNEVKGTGVPIIGTVGRRGVNFVEFHLLTLDFDGGTTIEAQREKLHGIRHLGYTSYNHLKDGTTHKFRIVLPLAKVVPADDFRARAKALAGAFPEADPASFKVIQIMFFPAKAPGVGEGRHQTWCEAGVDLDIYDYPAEEKPVIPPRPTPVSTPGVIGGEGRVLWDTLDVLAMFRGEGYYHKPGSRGKHIVRCPNEAQHSERGEPSGAIWDGSFGYNCWHAHCHDLRTVQKLFPAEVRAKYCRREATGLELVKGAKVEEDAPVDREVVRPQERTFGAPWTWEARDHHVTNFIKRALKHKHSVIQTEEGFGKSSLLVKHLRRLNKNVMFCCLSNAQVRSKLEDFAHYHPRRAFSFTAAFEEEFNISPEVRQVKGGLEEAVDFEATAQKLVKELPCSLEEAREVIKELRGKARSSQHLGDGLVITTFALGSVLFNREDGQLGREWVIIVDDPSLGDLHLGNYLMDGEGNWTVVEGTQRTADELPFGIEWFGHTPIIWTTTEKLTTKAILYQHQTAHVDIVAGDFATEQESVKLLPSFLANKALRKVIPGINTCVGEELELPAPTIIANGIGEEFNLVNNKGRNDLRGNNLVVCSVPHPFELATAAVAIGYEPTDGGLIKAQYVLDRTNQAVGRNQGYRAKEGATVLIVCSPGLQFLLECQLRYQVHHLTEERRQGTWRGLPIVAYLDNPIHLRWSAYARTWAQHVVTIGDRVINTLTLERLDKVLTKDEFKALQAVLHKPVKASKGSLRWKTITEPVEGEGRRNYLERVEELLEEANAALGKGCNLKAPGVLVLQPDGTRKKYKLGWTVPAGSKLANKMAKSRGWSISADWVICKQ